jgi:hypothetical protein
MDEQLRQAKTGVGRDPYAERGDDLYETPSGAVHALLRAELLPSCIWEPAAGHGNIVKVLREAGHTVLASDLVDYGEPSHFHGRDFLMEYQAPIGCEAIITNPPYKLADQFVRHALKLCPKVVMLLRLLFLEGTGRSDILDGPLARVHLFRNRLPRMHRNGWDGPKATSTVAFAWFVFEREHTGPINLSRITWEPEA